MTTDTSYIVCPSCAGEGLKLHRMTAAGESPFDQELPCALCRGSKTVTERQADKWRQHVQSRAEGRWPR